MRMCDKYRIKKYFADKLLTSDLSTTNVYRRSSDKGVFVTMIPTDTPKENLVVIEEHKKIGVLYTKTTPFDSHVFDFITNDNTFLHHASYLDGLVLVEVGNATLYHFESLINEYRCASMQQKVEDVRGKLRNGAINIIKNGGKV